MAESTPPKVRFAMLNGMAGAKIEDSLRQQAAWGVTDLDLKDGIFGQRIEDLPEPDAARLADLAAVHGLRTYCLSSGQLGATVEALLAPGQDGALRAAVARLITTAKHLRPRFIRLVTPTSPNVAAHRAELKRRGGNLEPLMAMYRESIDAITAAGFEVCIENEAFNCLLGSPDDVLAFFDLLGRPGKAVFTYDVQNLWEGGTFPSLEVYRRLKPLIGFVHLKGGRVGPDGRTLAFRSTLEHASWPVLDLVGEVVADGVSPVICINPSHGKVHPDFPMDDSPKRDLDFLRRHFA